MNNVAQSFTKALKENLDTFVYDNGTIDTKLELIVYNKMQILSTDTSFEIYGDIDSSITKEFMLNRKLVYNSMYIRIIDYNPTTNILTIENSIGDIQADTQFSIVIKDNLFIDYISVIPLKSQIDIGSSYSMLGIIYIKSYDDYNKNIIRNLKLKLDRLIVKNFRFNIPVYDFDSNSTTYNQIIANGTIKDNMQMSDISNLTVKDIANGYNEYRISFEIIYKWRY